MHAIIFLNEKKKYSNIITTTRHRESRNDAICWCEFFRTPTENSEKFSIHFQTSGCFYTSKCNTMMYIVHITPHHHHTILFVDSMHLHAHTHTHGGEKCEISLAHTANCRMVQYFRQSVEWWQQLWWRRRRCQHRHRSMHSLLQPKFISFSFSFLIPLCCWSFNFQFVYSLVFFISFLFFFMLLFALVCLFDVFVYVKSHTVIRVHIYLRRHPRCFYIHWYI